MNRSKLVREVAKRANINTDLCDKIVRALTEAITQEVASGEKVTISGFGTFQSKRRKATKARDPISGEKIDIKEQNVAAFRAGTGLKAAIKTTPIE